MNLDQILKDVEEFERVKGKATQGDWFVIYQDGKPRCIGSKDYGVVPNSDCAWDANEGDLNFIAAAKNFPAVEIIRDLVEEVKRLEGQLAQKDEVIGKALGLIEKVLNDEESRPGAWGPDVTCVGYLEQTREILKASNGL